MRFLLPYHAEQCPAIVYDCRRKHPQSTEMSLLLELGFAVQQDHIEYPGQPEGNTFKSLLMKLYEAHRVKLYEKELGKGETYEKSGLPF